MKHTRRSRRNEVNPASAGALPLPHEHDQVPEERADVRVTHQPEVAQAARDLDRGLVDTDNYARARETTRTKRTSTRR